MIAMIDEAKALNVIKKYFYLLENTGSVSDSMMKKLSAYLFLVDFVEYVHSFLTEEDYVAIDKVLKRLFTGGGCLLPYSVFCANKAKLGRNEYMGTFRIRVTEITRTDRSTENDYLRTV